MSLIKSVYNVFRSIIMTLIVLLVIVYVGLYVVLSVPRVQNIVKEKVCEEMSKLLDGSVDIRALTLRPFSEVMLSDLSLSSLEGERCVEIAKVAAGIDIWSLLSEGKIVLNYAEIIGLDAKVVQTDKNSPLNIQFLIEALSPKDKNKPSTVFDLRIRNIIVRDSKASYSRLWMKDSAGVKHRLADIDVSRLRMDLSIPVLRNDLFRFDVRNMTFESEPGVSVRSLTADVSFFKDTTSSGADRLLVEDFVMTLPASRIALGDIDLRLDDIRNIDATADGRLTPSDLSSLFPQLSSLDTPWEFDLDSSLRGDSLSVSRFSLAHDASSSSVSVSGTVKNFDSKESLDIELRELNAELSAQLIADAMAFAPKLSEHSQRVVRSLGHVSIGLEGALRSLDNAEAKGLLSTSIGNLDFSASGTRLTSSRPKMTLSASAEAVDIGRLIESEKIGRLSADIEASIEGKGRDAEGKIKLTSDECVLMGNLLSGIIIDVNKKKDNIGLSVEASSDDMTVGLDARTLIAGAASRTYVIMDVSGFNPSDFGVKGRMADCSLTARLAASTLGNSADNITGMIELSDASMTGSDGKTLSLSRLALEIDTLASDGQLRAKNLSGDQMRDIRLSCDWLDARISGHILPGRLAREMKEMLATVFPTLIQNAPLSGLNTAENDFTFDINIKDTQAPYAFFDLPVRPLTDIPIKGSIDAPHGKAVLTTGTPHLQQGKNKLLRNLKIDLDLDAFLGMAQVNAGLIFPAKKGDAELGADIYAASDKVNATLAINPTLESVVKGGVAMAATFSRIPDPFKPDGELAVRLDILPSTVTVNDMAWQIADGNLDYSGKRISVSNFLVSHDDQYVKIDGVASESPDDIVKVKLNDIDLEYIFNILNINYVSFGGMATGEVVGSRLLTKKPEARTEFLHVNGLSYNGATLGNGDLASEYDASEQKVGIYGVIRDPLTRERRASIEGGIWVTRDSLSFGFDANKIDIAFMKPFVAAFCSDIYGEATGKCRLFGKFTDIDLVGDLMADTLSMKLDFTNTWYHAGGDSVFLHRGVIEIPPLTLYDDESHTAEFSGWLQHTYFHNPVFSFRLRDAKSLLCYNTNEKLNPLWYGTIYGSGHAQINGRPGLIDIDMNMTTEEGSRFYYVISDAEDVAQYSFLSFTDRRKESRQATVTDTVPDYLKRFHKQTEQLDAGSSNVVLSLKGTVTNDALVTLVMDPRAGDNITARGQGALQMDYNLASNDLRMIGTYVLDEGNYNFTLQDIIIKNFSIRKGSLIKFDGDPMKAVLDIAATYRVNTNLTDLDKSFSTDKELNRTNVPVDAVLLVDGPMTNPDITFDIELPSLTSDVERKVKSIVSTNDMMSRQIIYLLALNRFYTPEYTGGQSNGSEWSSMASSTISSQLSNILSQMTDKLDVAPSFRSEKGDFTDMEFDLALSSRLLNNRLLINGNFGYRDRSTSNTQFVGDFDIEYLLSKNGNLRLKAYNHFNDQNYYLRSALTTQGVGVVFRKDFDRLFRRKEEEKTDSVETSTADTMMHESPVLNEGVREERIPDTSAEK